MKTDPQLYLIRKPEKDCMAFGRISTSLIEGKITVRWWIKATKKYFISIENIVRRVTQKEFEDIQNGKKLRYRLDNENEEMSPAEFQLNRRRRK